MFAIELSSTLAVTPFNFLRTLPLKLDTFYFSKSALGSAENFIHFDADPDPP